MNWLGSTPTTCDLCKKKLVKVFVDGMTSLGPWGMLCVKCHKTKGVGLGLGRGQRYEKQKNGAWKKTAG